MYLEGFLVAFYSAYKSMTMHRKYITISFISCWILGSIMSLVHGQDHIHLSQPTVLGGDINFNEDGSILQLDNDGLLLPRMDSASIYQIIDPANGLMVLDTTNFCLFIYEQGLWWQDCSFIPMPIADPEGPEPAYIETYKADGTQEWTDVSNYPDTFHRVLYQGSSTEWIDFQPLVTFLTFNDDLDPGNNSPNFITFITPTAGTYFFSAHVTIDGGGSAAPPPPEAPRPSLYIDGCFVDHISEIEIHPEIHTRPGREITYSLSGIQRLKADCAVFVALQMPHNNSDVRIGPRVFTAYLLSKD